jgi:hypothetical protein
MLGSKCSIRLSGKILSTFFGIAMLKGGKRFLLVDAKTEQ